MPTVLTGTPASPPQEPPRKKWTRFECRFLESTGLFQGQQLELVDGELINKMGKKRPHTITLTKLLVWMLRTFGDNLVNPETSIDVSPEENPTNEPQPDLIVLKRPQDELFTTPQPTDLHLVVEVSDSSLLFDLTTKATLYARAGIAEYWVVDINSRRLIVHRDPENGVYGSITAFIESESVSPLGAPDARLRVGDILA